MPRFIRLYSSWLFSQANDMYSPVLYQPNVLPSFLSETNNCDRVVQFAVTLIVLIHTWHDGHRAVYAEWTRCTKTSADQLNIVNDEPFVSSHRKPVRCFIFQFDFIASIIVLEVGTKTMPLHNKTPKSKSLNIICRPSFHYKFHEKHSQM